MATDEDLCQLPLNLRRGRPAQPGHRALPPTESSLSQLSASAIRFTTFGATDASILEDGHDCMAASCCPCAKLENLICGFCRSVLTLP